MAGGKLRILQVIRSPIGGLFRHVVDLSTALAEKGHDVGLVMDSTLQNEQTLMGIRKLAPALSLGIHKFPIPRLLGPADIVTPFRLRKLARTLGIDVLHGHGAKGGFLARLARSGPGKRVAVYTPHGGVLHFDRASLGGRAFLAIEKALLMQTDAVCFESLFAQKTYTANIATPRCPAPVIYNGLSNDEFNPVTNASSAHDFAFIGELRELKGIFRLLDALAGLSKPGGGKPTLIVAGDGPARSRVVARISRPDLAGRVELAGVMPARDLFALGRCVVIPSLAESLPYVVLEAIAAGKPVIATDVGGIGEIFGPTADELVPPDDTEKLAGRMQLFLDDRHEVEKSMKRRFGHVRSTFSIAYMAGDVEALYGQVLRTRR